MTGDKRLRYTIMLIFIKLNASVKVKDDYCVCGALRNNQNIVCVEVVLMQAKDAF